MLARNSAGTSIANSENSERLSTAQDAGKSVRASFQEGQPPRRVSQSGLLGLKPLLQSCMILPWSMLRSS